MALGSLSGASSRAARWPAVAGPGASPSRGPLTRTPRPRPPLPLVQVLDETPDRAGHCTQLPSGRCSPLRPPSIWEQMSLVC